MSPDMPLLADQPFDPEQKEYLQGFFAGLAFREPFVGHLPNGQITSTPKQGLVNVAAAPATSAEEAESVFGTPLADLCEQEIWKLERNGLDTWDELMQHAAENKFPDKKYSFLFRFHAIIERCGRMSREAAADYVRQLKAMKRYQRDVY